MYFPILDLTINVYLIVTLGFFGGILAGFFGIGGGVVITPVLMYLGVPPKFAVAASANQMIASSGSSLLSRIISKSGERMMDIKLGIIMSCFSILGVEIGNAVLKAFHGNEQALISVGYLVILGLIGTVISVEAVTSRLQKLVPHANIYENYKRDWKAIFGIKVYFDSCGTEISIMLIMVIGIFSGLLISILGVGGGFIILPILFYVIKIPHNIAIGISLIQVLISALRVTFINVIEYNNLDIMLSAFLMVTSVIGGQIGTHFSRKIDPSTSRVMLGIFVLTIGFLFGDRLFTMPNQLYTLESV